MLQVKNCPIQIGFYRSCLGKKWTLTIIRDLLFGMSKFSDFLKTNPDLSSKVLSERLKELEIEGLITKNIISTTPVVIKYQLTQKGSDLNRILYELSIFGSKHYPEEVFGETQIPFKEAINLFGKGFKLSEEEIVFNQSPVVSTRPYLDNRTI